ncbi:unnamed protein product [Sphagnum jensenii]|uniref:Uncharacterized protein n=1 Tax=Sphagnum jensenii TaxID=128206 RepID=A0ABP1C1V3_9BRYO
MFKNPAPLGFTPNKALGIGHSQNLGPIFDSCQQECLVPQALSKRALSGFGVVEAGARIRRRTRKRSSERALTCLQQSRGATRELWSRRRRRNNFGSSSSSRRRRRRRL